MRRALGIVALALLAGGCGGMRTTTVTVTTTVTSTRTVTAAAPSSGACTGDALSGRFAVVPGSAGAGNIVYRLTLTNASSASCSISGLPAVQLLDANGASLPTTVRPAQPGTATAAKVTLAPGASATADARFSPDVPGVGETGSPCEPTAATLRVTAPGGGTVSAPIAPTTSVCSHGAMSFSAYAAA